MSKSESSRSEVISETKSKNGLKCFSGRPEGRSSRAAPFADGFTTELYLSPPIEDTYSNGPSWNRSPVHNRFDITRSKHQMVAVSTPQTRYSSSPTASPKRRPDQSGKQPSVNAQDSRGFRTGSIEDKDQGRRPSTSSSSSSSKSSKSSSSKSYNEVETAPQTEIYETESVRQERSSPRMSEKQLYKSSLSPPAKKKEQSGWFCASGHVESEKSSHLADRSSDDSSDQYKSPPVDDSQSEGEGRSRWCPAIPKRQSKTGADAGYKSSQRNEAIPIVRQSLPAKGSNETLHGSAANPLLIDYMGSTQKRSSGQQDFEGSDSRVSPSRKTLTARILDICRGEGSGTARDKVDMSGSPNELRVPTPGHTDTPSSGRPQFGRETSVLVSEGPNSPRKGGYASFEDGPSPNGPSRGGLLNMCCMSSNNSDKTDKYKLSLPAEMGAGNDSPIGKQRTVRIDMDEDLIAYRDLRQVKTSVVTDHIGLLDYGGSATVSRHVEALRGCSTVSYALLSADQETKFGSYTPLKTDCYTAYIHGATLESDVISLASVAAKKEYPRTHSRRLVAWTSKKYTLKNASNEVVGLVFELGVDGMLRASLMTPTSSPAMQNTYFDVHLTLTTRAGEADPVIFVDKYVTMPGNCPMPIKFEEGFSIQPDDLAGRVDAQTQLLIMVTMIQPQDRGGLAREVSTLYRSNRFNLPPTPIADVTIVCENQVYPALRGVLMARSRVFHEMLQNKSRAVIAVTGASSSMVKNLIDYCHTDTCDLISGKEDDLQSQIKLFETAVRFEVEALANELCVRFLPRLTSETLPSLRQTAQKTGHVYLMETVVRYENAYNLPPVQYITGETATRASVEASRASVEAGRTSVEASRASVEGFSQTQASRIEPYRSFSHHSRSSMSSQRSHSSGSRRAMSKPSNKPKSRSSSKSLSKPTSKAQSRSSHKERSSLNERRERSFSSESESSNHSNRQRSTNRNLIKSLSSESRDGNKRLSISGSSEGRMSSDRRKSRSSAKTKSKNISISGSDTSRSRDSKSRGKNRSSKATGKAGSDSSSGYFS